MFYATNTCPKGMCDAAWRTINQYVFALACGVSEFYGGGWMKEPGKVITCCNDGLRPVYFKLEATGRTGGTLSGQGLKERGARRPVARSGARAGGCPPGRVCHLHTRPFFRPTLKNFLCRNGKRKVPVYWAFFGCRRERQEKGEANFSLSTSWTGGG